MKLDVINIEGKSTGRSVELSDEVFGVAPNEHAVYLSVKQYRANQRQGTHSAKERNAIKGSRKKIKKQKGTGTARVGDIKNPLFRGGGRVFGPRPRSHGFKLNKKVKSLAKKSALSVKASAGDIMILEDFTFDAPKTRELVNVLTNLKLQDSKVLLVTGENDRVLSLSGRNIPGAQVMEAKDINTYQVLKANKVVLSESSLTPITEMLSNKQS